MPSNSLDFSSPDAHTAFVEELDFLTQHCPKGKYRETCPFQMLSGVSRSHRLTILTQMDLGQIEGLFALTGDCRCPNDPRGPAPAPSEETAT
jgi:hypothetical protein